MSKPNIYGSYRSFLPNNRADSRRRKVWEHNRQIAERDPLERRREKEMKESEREKVRGYAHRYD
jgi:hypothetical protein